MVNIFYHEHLVAHKFLSDWLTSHIVIITLVLGEDIDLFVSLFEERIQTQHKKIISQVLATGPHFTKRFYSKNGVVFPENGLVYSII